MGENDSKDLCTADNSILRTAVIGAGYLGEFHAQKYAALPQTKLVAVADKNATRANEVAQKLSTTALSDYRSLLSDVDAVSIASPTTTHFKIAKEFLTAGVSVLVEKPMTVTTDEAEELIAIARSTNAVLQVGHLERFNPALLAVADQIQTPTFIESHRLAPYTVRGTDVNVVLDLMIHDIDIILNLVKANVSAIHANGTAIISDAIDIANVRLEFDNGCVANVTASRVSEKRERRIRVFQREKYIAVDFQQNSNRVCVVDRTQPAIDDLPHIQCENTQLEKGDAILAEIEAFIRAIQTNSPPLVTGEDGLRALQTAIAIGKQIT
ncbi:MAG: Gfo/Idh/MocA family oxidoreductase [Gammaproteobacteria bacterium]|nr:Gfo/Idh/MocA family oxidoreductase [Gammaproteobacteria bacterium]